MNPAEPYPVRSVETVEVIRTESVWGKGIEDDPVRIIRQYWLLDGSQLVKVDHWLVCKDCAEGDMSGHACTHCHNGSEFRPQESRPQDSTLDDEAEDTLMGGGESD